MHPRMMLVPAFGLVLLATVLGVSYAKESPGNPERAQIERGVYLVTVGSCNDCHSPKVFTAGQPEPDASRLLSGHPAAEKLPPVPAGVIGPEGWGAITNNHLTAWAGPWGVSYAANLTPDATGLAAWTADTFIQAMRTGKHAGVGRPILPPMPWPNFGRMSDEDLRAIFAYLKSLPPVANAVPAPVPPAAPPPAR